MKKFILKIIIFCIPAFLLFLSALICYSISKINTDTKLNELSAYEHLLMGDSQIQRIHGELIFENTQNIASSAEHYYFTYQKLLTLVQNKNHRLDTLILGVSIHSFAPVYNRLFSIDFPEGKRSLERYLYFIQRFDESDFLTDYEPLLKPLIVGIFSEPYWGGFHESDHSNPTEETINTTFDMHFSIKQNEEKFSYSQRAYLYKIDSLCTANNIDLILLSTPYHSLYKEKLDSDYVDFFLSTLGKLDHRYHLNFIGDDIDPSLMSDANHLNKLGAIKYSKIINKALNTQYSP